MSRQTLVLGALALVIGIVTFVISFAVVHEGIVRIVLQVAGAFLLLVSFSLFGWHICSGGGNSSKKVLKTKNRSKRPREIDRYGHDNFGGPGYEGGVTVIRTGSARGKSGQRSRGHHSQNQQQHYQQQQQQQYQYQQQQQQQYHPQSNGGGGHGYVVSADGYVQHQQQQPQQQQQQQQQVQYNGQGVQYSSNHGVQFNPGGSSTNRMMAGGVNSGYHGSMDSINSNTLSYDSDLSTGSFNTGQLRRSCMKKTPAKDNTSVQSMASVGSQNSKKSGRSVTIAIGSEQTQV